MDYRRTKIVATLGPASANYETIIKLIDQGVNVFRLNFSHGTHEQHQENTDLIRKISKEKQQNIAILADLQGPKIRIGKVPNKHGIHLRTEQEFIITTSENDEVHKKQVFCSYKPLSKEVKEGSRILLDDGLLELEVSHVEQEKIYTKVVVGGLLTSNKGINLPNVKLNTPALTEKDQEDLIFILRSLDVDFVALSFVRKAEDLELVHQIMNQEQRKLFLVAKIEKPEALLEIDDIIAKCDGIMIARGDLGIEIPQEMVPIKQKEIIHKCNIASKPVIVATQMLDSMIRNPRPTRAEVSDVANAVLDGASAVMLSGESAAGNFPVESVITMSNIIKTTEKSYLTPSYKGYKRLKFTMQNDVQAICYSAVNLASKMHAKCIMCISDTGTTALEIARYRPNIPIVALVAKDNPNLRNLCLVWGIHTLEIETFAFNDECFYDMEEKIENLSFLEDDDLIVALTGLPLMENTPTNMIKLHRVQKGVKSLFKL